MIDAEDELDLALNPDANVSVAGLDDPDAAATVDFGAGGESPVAPNPAAAFDPTFAPPPEYGPPTPPELAGPTAPAGAGPNETWPPAVPTEAPGNVGAPGAPVSAAQQGQNLDQSLEGALGDVDQARAESDEAKKKQFEGAQDVERAKTEYAHSRVQELEQRQAADQARAKSDAAADAKAKASVADADAKLRGFQFGKLWANQTTAEKVGKVLSSALLAIGAGMMKTPKYAMEILDKEREADHQAQMDNLKKLNDDYVRAETGYKDAAAGRAKIAADISLARARKDDLLAARFEEAAQTAKDANSRTDALAYAAKLHQDSAQAKVSSLTTMRALHVQEEKSALETRLKESQIAGNESLKNLRDRGLGQGRKLHGAGGTGGGGGGYDAFRSAVINAQDPNNIPDLGKLAAHAGIKPNQIADQVRKIRTEGGAEKNLASRNDFAESRKKFLDEKMANLAGSLDVVDADGKPLGKAPDPKSADRLRKQVQTYDQFRVRMEALRDYVKEHGDRGWSVDDIQHRDSLGAAAAAAGRVYNGLGGTDASQKLEADINGARGTPGHGWMAGANLDILEHNLSEAAHQHQTRINTSLRAGAPGAKPHAEGGGGENKNAAQIASAKKWLTDNPKADPALRKGVEDKIASLGG